MMIVTRVWAAPGAAGLPAHVRGAVWQSYQFDRVIMSVILINSVVIAIEASNSMSTNFRLAVRARSERLHSADALCRAAPRRATHSRSST